MKVKIVFFSVILIQTVFSKHIFTQEYSVFENYYLNTFSINPAFTGVNYYQIVNLSAKKQWLGFTDSPSTYLISADLKIGNFDFYDPKGFINKGPMKQKERVGFGGLLFTDNEGPVSTTGGLISYAYHIPLNYGQNLSFGLSGIGIYKSINSSILKPDQPDDEYLLTNNSSVFRANVNFGALFYSKTYFVGISANKLLKDISIDYFDLTYSPSIYLVGGYKFLKDNINLNYEPSIIVKRVGNDNIRADVNLKFYIKRLNWVALSYSSVGKVNLRFGLHLIKQVYVGYNYEQPLTKMANYSLGSHEINVGINLGMFMIDNIKETVD